MFKKSLLITAFLNIPLCIGTLYASNGQEDMQLELESKKRKASCDLSLQDTQLKKNKITEHENTSNTLMICEKNPLSYMPLGLFPQEVQNHLVRFLCVEERNRAALVSHSFYKAARTTQMMNDIRALKDKKWQGGPTLNSFESYLETYLLNSIVWKMSCTRLHQSSFNEADLKIFMKGASFLNRYFVHIEHLDTIIEGLSDLDNYLVSYNRTTFEEYTKKNPRSGEDDFLSSLIYIGTQGIFYKLPKILPPHLNLVERKHSSLLAEQTLYRRNITLAEHIQAWETLERDTLKPLDNLAFTREINHLFSLAKQNDKEETKLKCYERAAHLCDTLLIRLENKEHPIHLTYGLYAHASVGKLTSDSEQKQASLERGAELGEFLLNITSYQLDQENLDNITFTYSLLWKNTQDPTKKMTYAKRTADLYDTLLIQTNRSKDAYDLEKAASAYLYVGQHSTDPEQKLTAFERAAHLYKSFISKNGNKTPIQYIRDAALAHLSLAKNTTNPAKKLMASMGATELYDLILTEKKQNALQDIKSAAFAHLGLAQHTTNLTQTQKKAYRRAAELFDQILDATKDHSELKNIMKNSARIHFSLAELEGASSQKEKLYRKANHLYNKLSEKAGESMKIQDLRNAAFAHKYIAEHEKNLQKQSEMYTRSATLYDTILHKSKRSPEISDIKNGALVHYHLAQNETDTVKKLASYIRCSGLFDDLFKKTNGRISNIERSHASNANHYIRDNTMDLELKVNAIERIHLLEFKHALFF